MNILYALLEKLKEQWCPYCGGEHTNCVLDKKWFSHEVQNGSDLPNLRQSDSV